MSKKKETAVQRAQALAAQFHQGQYTGTENLSVAELAGRFSEHTALSAPEVQRKAPGMAVQRIHHGYTRSPRTAEEARVAAEIRAGLDPGLNQKFETATEAKEFRKINSVETMSVGEFRSQIGTRGGMWSSRGDYGKDIDTNVKGFNPEAFSRGRQFMEQNKST